MKTISRLPLNALRAFEAVARLGSMARAAEALNVQPSAVSMQIKNLSEYIGVPLVAVRGRALNLTPEGQALYPAVLSGLSQIEASVASLRSGVKGRPCIVSVLPSFLHCWLLPRIADLYALTPPVAIEIQASLSLVDIRRGDADAAIRLGAGEWKGLRSVKLMDEYLVPVCAPALQARVGFVRRGTLPTGAPLLATSRDGWSRWDARAARTVNARISVDDPVAIIREAELEKGVALARLSLASESLKIGRLVPVGPCIPYPYSYYWVDGGTGRRVGSAARIRDWLLEQARDHVLTTAVFENRGLPNSAEVPSRVAFGGGRR